MLAPMRTLALSGIALLLAVLAGAGSASGAGGPGNRVAPSIHGAAQEGSVLKAQHGRWSDPNVFYSYLWRRCNADGTACGDIANANDQIYAPRPEDVGHSL